MQRKKKLKERLKEIQTEKAEKIWNKIKQSKNNTDFWKTVNKLRSGKRERVECEEDALRIHGILEGSGEK